MVLFVMLMSGVSLLTAMLTVYLDNQSGSSSVPRPIRFIFFHVIARLLCMRDVTRESIVKPEVFPVGPKLDNEAENGNVSLIELDLKANLTNLDAILRELRVITSQVRAAETRDAQQEDWKMLARVIDRILFCICLIACFIYFVTFLNRALD